ncbi:sporulation integral membrane protein YtvI [Sutcliffiella cohnii]|uniref:Sporulation integral membrane protein YtvI n=1 Tax=Sutcliffiella cohnii TaxID=33932 RepID=A0A223KSW2_9BACI|nr:sporulation integral membrane protein YtvI [Sutcliffiella cohnii]AST92582.1 sporulation integral membrane protein YtvI [Sutcliffiella cohnii]
MLSNINPRKVLIILFTIATIVFVYINFSVFSPVLFALLTAIIFEPFIRLLKKQLKFKSRIIPVLITFLLFILTSTGVIYITLTRILKSFNEWMTLLPRYVLDIQNSIDALILKVNDLIYELPQHELVIREMNKQAEGLIDLVLKLTSHFASLVGSWLQAVPNFLFVSLVYLITLFLFSLDLPRLFRLLLSLFSEETANKMQIIFTRLGKVFMGYWKAQLIMSIGVFIITYISLLFITPKQALIMAFIIWIVDIIPLYIGPALVLIPWGLLMIILGSSATGIQLMVLAIALTIIRRIVEPKILGDSIGLAALPTILTMYFGYVFFGVLGLIFGPFVYIAMLSIKETGLFERKKQIKD